MKFSLVALENLTVSIKNGKSIRQDKNENGIPITRIETIAYESIDPSRVGYAGLTDKDVGSYLLEEGDILFSHINSLDHLGKCAQYKGVPEKLLHGMNLLNIRVDSSIADSRYVLHALRAPEQRNQFQRIANKSVNQASIAAGNLKKVRIPLPTLPDQRRIAAILEGRRPARPASRRHSQAG